MKIPINKITIGERQRLAIGSLDDLETMGDESIGLIQPIIVRTLADGSYELVAGRRRIARAVELGWTDIEAFDKGHLTDVQKQEMEFFEDIGRTGRSWQDKCLSIEKLFKLKQMQREGAGETWTVRTMAAMLGKGYSKSSVNYMMQIAEEIRTNPSGDIAQADGYTNAVKHLIIRHEREVNTEMERRRHGAQTTKEVADLVFGDKPVQIDPETGVVSPVEPVQQLDTTQELVVLIRGSKEVPKQMFRTVISYNFDATLVNVIADDGHAIMFSDYSPFFEPEQEPGFEIMPYPVIWDKYLTPDTKDWPFAHNYAIGIYIRGVKGAPIVFDKPLTATIKCVQSDTNLPRQVIHHILNAIGVPNGPVLCLGNIDLVAVAEWGAVPIWVEPDAVRFNERAEELENHYINTILGVTVRRQE